jgi:PAS domain S-box-containing protein
MFSKQMADSRDDHVFHGGGETGELLRARDWSQTALGPVEAWPAELKTAVSLCLNSPLPMGISWGPELVLLYNDAYARLLGTSHPAAFGAAIAAGMVELRRAAAARMQAVFATGVPFTETDLLIPIDRGEGMEETYFSFSHSPIRDAQGAIAGIFTPVVETTQQVLAERRQRTLQKLRHAVSRRPRNARDVARYAMKVLAANPQDVPFAAIYLEDATAEGQPRVRLAARVPAGGDPAFLKTLTLENAGWIPWKKWQDHAVHSIPLAATGVAPLPTAPWGIPPAEGVLVPLQDPATHQRLGFLFAGVSAYRTLDAGYREFFESVAAEIATAISSTENLARLHLLQAEADAERTKIRDLFLQAPAAIAILRGPQHIFTLANHSYLRLVGRQSAAELIGRPLAEALPELEGQGILDRFDRVFATGRAEVITELPVRLERQQSGQPVLGYFNFVAQPARDAEGRVESILVLATEATEEVLARRESELREEQFRVLADSIPQLVWIADPDGSLTWYNRRWYEYSGTTWEQMQGWGWQSLHHPDYLPKVIAHYKHSLETGDPFEMTFPLRGADGVYRPFLTLALPVRDSTGTIIRWFGTNTAMETQYKAEAALRETEKLAVVGRLAASIAHEINNPLEGVTNLIYLARLAADNQETKSYLSAAEKELARVAQITNQTLRFHRQQSAATATDVSELLESILTLYRGKLTREGIRLIVEKRETPVLVCYAGEVRQVLANLIGNALDAMPKGGTLRIRLRPATNWCDGRPGARFTIADTGHGIPKQVRKRIYEPFFTTKGEVGTGLGLWVSAGIVDKGGGSIHVRSSTEPGRSGTVFTLSFPDSPGIPDE